MKISFSFLVKFTLIFQQEAANIASEFQTLLIVPRDYCWKLLRRLNSVHTSTQKIKTSLQSNFSDMAATDSPCLLKGSPFWVTCRREVFIRSSFQIIFPLPENPIKEFSSHFSFMTEAKVHLSVKEHVFKTSVHTISWEMFTEGKENILHRGKKALNFLSNGLLQAI